MSVWLWPVPIPASPAAPPGYAPSELPKGAPAVTGAIMALYLPKAFNFELGAQLILPSTMCRWKKYGATPKKFDVWPVPVFGIGIIFWSVSAAWLSRAAGIVLFGNG